MSDLDFIKHNLLELAKEHKNKCTGDCSIQLVSLRLACDMLGIILTDEEKTVFM